MSNAYPNGSASQTSATNTAIPGASVGTPGPDPATANLQPETLQLTSAEDRARQEQTRKAVIVAAIVGVVSLLLLIGIIIFLAADAARAAHIRDIVLVLTAAGTLLMTVAIGILMVVLIYRIQELIAFLRGELIPVISKVGSTVNQVTGTASFVSDNVAKPTIKVASMVAGLQQMARTANSKVRGGR
jgi:hypothetical protein